MFQTFQFVLRRRKPADPRTPAAEPARAGTLPEAEAREAGNPGSEPGAASSRLRQAAVLPAARELGLALYELRLEHGLSLRELARKMGFSAHSGFAAFEQGRRIPSEELIAQYELVFGPGTGSLRALRAKALGERAHELTRQLAEVRFGQDGLDTQDVGDADTCEARKPAGQRQRCGQGRRNPPEHLDEPAPTIEGTFRDLLAVRARGVHLSWAFAGFGAAAALAVWRMTVSNRGPFADRVSVFELHPLDQGPVDSEQAGTGRPPETVRGGAVLRTFCDVSEVCRVWSRRPRIRVSVAISYKVPPVRGRLLEPPGGSVKEGSSMQEFVIREVCAVRPAAAYQSSNALMRPYSRQVRPSRLSH
jgi:transcriptional regulator with XRE-family HTH domain